MKTNKAVSDINKQLIEDGIIGGFDLGRTYPELENHVLLAVTELRTKEEIDALVEKMGAYNA